MSPQGAVAVFEEVADRNVSRRSEGAPAHPAAQLLEVGTTRVVAVHHRLVDPLQSVGVEDAVVVDLRNVPSRALPGVLPGIRRRTPGEHRQLVSANVVGVRVPTLLVVGHQHMRSELTDDAHQRLGTDLKRDARKAVRRQRLVALRQPRILVAEPAVCDVDRCRRAAHLDATEPGHVALGHRQLVRGKTLILHVATLAARAADHQHLVAEAAVMRVGGRALARLVVGMGVHC